MQTFNIPKKKEKKIIFKNSKLTNTGYSDAKCCTIYNGY